MRIVVTGGAGFLGSHLCDALVARGDTVVCIDDLSSGCPDNIGHHLDHPRFTFQHADVSLACDVEGRVDAVAHLASPASPVDYQLRPLDTLAVGSRGTEHCLQLARRHDARFLLASTSEVYGDPQVHPQTEAYWGNVNPIGPRSVYDEAKRFAEALTAAYRRTCGVDTGIVRIFNTYGPRMRPQDGRVVSSFVAQALRGEPLTIFGDGSQTRSFCYVDDLVRGLVAMLDAPEPGPVNLGNPEERTVAELAGLVLAMTGSASPVVHLPLPVEDPTRRRPVIELARDRLGWAPQVTTEQGLARTIAWFATRSGPPAGSAAPAALAAPGA
ncbi:MULTISPECIES: UDP-glucuronic acid decarboxylase family protein [unclassified Pseudonocardia]|uniref:UDP-glucuronic acid decarboxylase family protein n=1 Tax=unclassified Pseudonocardia TaxID=2619320 RepID=UPI000AE898A8|nr:MULTISPECIES: UDP-glucuronic acid decarboxylase family protein [unclassified Pseudonocardia]MBN9102197.1 SDR family oxidoreductase [Pseudonocardia sp.]